MHFKIIIFCILGCFFLTGCGPTEESYFDTTAKLCSYAGDDCSRNECLRKVASISSDAKYCEEMKITNSHTYSACTMGVVAGIQNASSCKNLPEEYRNVCLFLTNGQTAPHLCQNISDADLSDTCWRSVALDTKNPAYCERKLFSHDERSDVCYVHLAQSITQPTQCEDLPGEFKYICQFSQGIPITACESIKNVEYQNYCWRDSAIQKKDSSDCKNISFEDYRGGSIHSECITQVAKLQNNSAICDLIEKGVGRNPKYCKTAVAQFNREETCNSFTTRPKSYNPKYKTIDGIFSMTRIAKDNIEFRLSEATDECLVNLSKGTSSVSPCYYIEDQVLAQACWESRKSREFICPFGGIVDCIVPRLLAAKTDDPLQKLSLQSIISCMQEI